MNHKDLEDYIQACLIDVAEGNDPTVNAYLKNYPEEIRNHFLNGIKHAFALINDYASLELIFEDLK